MSIKLHRNPGKVGDLEIKMVITKFHKETWSLELIIGRYCRLQNLLVSEQPVHLARRYRHGTNRPVPHLHRILRTGDKNIHLRCISCAHRILATPQTNRKSRTLNMKMKLIYRYKFVKDEGEASVKVGSGL